MQSRKAITLVELIVAMTISMLLMASIGVFVSSGMQTLFLQQKSLQNLSEIADFSAELSRTIEYASSGEDIAKVGSGIVFKRQRFYDYGGFSYIGTSKVEGLFCDDIQSEDTNTHHIFIKNFIPFFEKGESTIEDTYTASAGEYVSDRRKHIITKNGIPIIGRGIFGDRFIPGSSGTGVYLNSPTGLALDNYNNLYVSDTLNDRILYLSGSKVYPLLDFDDGIREPTGLWFDEIHKSLYIANSGKGEILELSSINKPGNYSFTGSINVEKDISHVSQLSIDFLSTGGPLDLKLPTNTESFQFSSNIPQSEDFLTGSVNKLNYYFNDFGSQERESPITSGCTEGSEYIFEHKKLKKQIRNCSTAGTGTLITYSSSTNIALYPGETYDFQIDNIEIGADSATGNYYANVKLLDDNDRILYEKDFPFIVNGDNIIYTLQDNILRIVEHNLEYPNGIWGPLPSDVNTFSPLSPVNYTLDINNDIYLTTPIRNLDITQDAKLWNFIIKYYRNYNCYNLEENQEKIKTHLMKKKFK